MSRLLYNNLTTKYTSAGICRLGETHMKFYHIAASAFLLVLATTFVSAAPVTYKIDGSHTYPSFEADHMGLSVWRGKINKNSGTVVLDVEANTGSVTVLMDMTSIDFGHDGMNEHGTAEDILNVEKFPTATYVGTLADFVDGAPTAVEGNLTLHGVTKPVNLKINKFLCKIHPRSKREVCGADASATFNRDEFGIDYAKKYGFNMAVDLQIAIEAKIAE